MAEWLWPVFTFVVGKKYDRLTGLGKKPIHSEMNVRVNFCEVNYVSKAY